VKAAVKENEKEKNDGNETVRKKLRNALDN
jgi:hypothetical protein